MAEFVRRIDLYPWSTIQDKYEHPCLPLYRKHIAALADGEEPPPISREALEKASLRTLRNLFVALSRVAERAQRRVATVWGANGAAVEKVVPYEMTNAACWGEQTSI